MGTRTELVRLIQRAAVEAENMQCDMSVASDHPDRDSECPACAMPVQVFSAVGNEVRSVIADVEGLVDIIMSHLNTVVPREEMQS